ncbi:hypothetical protein DPMN_083541 [Dreissena polymorpha]|uniref:Reverse transcriptase domain-containing protein n=1 Tax=Dreissena polymorpha TaxID=45954 RepID=A0A9D3Y931_DREPO|nr:hypothetical protein DPMN_083541 [Dreissena polymorpha]
MIEKHLKRKHELVHIFIDCNKAYDRVRHDGLCQLLREFKIDEGLAKVVQEVHGNAISEELSIDGKVTS